MAKLIIRSGPQTGMEFPLDRPVIRLGRGSGSDIILQTSQASRQHAEISQQGNQFFIRDLGSTNGTFVNNQQVTAPRPLQPGDQVRIGDVVLAFDLGAAAMTPGPAMAGAAATDWEAELWDDDMAGVGSAGGRSKTLVWVMAAVIAIVVVAIGVGAVFVLRGEATPTPVAEPTVAPTAAIVVVSTPTQEAKVPTVDTPLVDVDVDVDVPPVDVDVPEPGDVPVAPGDLPVAPKDLPISPGDVPVSPQELEQLPSVIQQFLGDVPPEQLPQVISEQMGMMSQEQLQLMIGSLFPGVDPSQLPQVVAASFPELPQSEIEALLGQVFPGQSFQLPDMGGSLGGQIALMIPRESDGGFGLYLVNASGGQSTLLVETASEPDFSPDGQWLVYYSAAGDRLGLRLIKRDGSEDTQLTTGKEHGYPSFSPDGQRIVFHHYLQDEMYVINRDGTGEHGIGKGQYPAWSPTGNQIVYRGCVSGGQCGLVVANADGSNPRQITTHANDAAPRWSPNGGQITFHSDRDGNWEIYVINVDGSWLRRITNKPATDVMPVWSPDGLKIAFRSDRGGQPGVYVTSGIGGLATKVIDAELVADWAFNQMDWAK